MLRPQNRQLRTACGLIAVWLFTQAGPAPKTYAQEPSPWATYRGNPQRTGHTDARPGPQEPAVAWHVVSQDHYVASPVPLGEDRILFSALGAFNRPLIQVYPLSGKTPLWARTAPFLKLPTVSSPATSGQVLVLGDGMHQDSGGFLRCLTLDTGLPLWELALPGELVHLEGAPTIAHDCVFIGAGAAGVLAVELNKATLDGQSLDLKDIRQRQRQKWADLQAQYEKDKKKDPDFAIPPSEDQLHKPQPKLLWQAGEKRWHVDAPVNYHNGRLFVASSYLDKEKVGERALFCLDSRTGQTQWRAELALNPWGGASLLGQTVIVTGSSVGYYFNQLKGAKGDISAFNASNGQPLWRKEIPTGGVVGCAALADDLAVCTSTDGKVRAFKIADGERAWLYDARTPFFAPPAIAAGTVYVADLLGVVHALEMKTGRLLWRFDAARTVNAPGMVYGGPTLHDGKIFLATANLEGPSARKPTAIICLGSK